MKNLFCAINFLLISNMLFLTSCGGGSSGDSTTTQSTNDGTGSGNDSGDTSDDTIDTAKLEETPFQGIETGDDFDWRFFLCDDYRTDKIVELPIKIFAAYFTSSEEEIIQEGINIANTAMGPTDAGGVFYELTDTWSDDARVIYKVDAIVREDGVEFDADGHIRSVESRFDGKSHAATVVSDWRMELVTTNKWLVAHELGHAAGISTHGLIDYDLDIISSENLETDSLMEPTLKSNSPELTDYNFMMAQQAQILQDHLGELGNLGGETCSD